MGVVGRFMHLDPSIISFAWAARRLWKKNEKNINGQRVNVPAKQAPGRESCGFGELGGRDSAAVGGWVGVGGLGIASMTSDRNGTG